MGGGLRDRHQFRLLVCGKLAWDLVVPPRELYSITFA